MTIPVAKLGSSVADQGITAAAGLLLHIGLARVLTPSEYGSFAIGFSVLIFFLGIHTTLVTEPLSVLGPARYADRSAAYVRTTLRLQTVLSLGFAFLAALAAAILRRTSPLLATALAAMAVSLVPYLLLAWTRRVGYMRDRPRTALVASSVYGLVLVVGGGFLLATERVTIVHAYVLLGGASLAGCLPLVWTLRSAPEPVEGSMAWRHVAGEHWTYGRWVLWGGIAHWMGSGLLVPALGFLVSLEGAGAFRALSHFAAPIQQWMAVATLLLLPRLAARAPGSRFAGPLRRSLGHVAALVVPVAVAYAVLLAVWGGVALDRLYEQDAYSTHRSLLHGFAAYVVVLAATHALTLVFRAREDTRSVFVSKVVAAAATWALGLPLIQVLGLAGAVWALSLSTVAEGLVLAFRIPRSLGYDRSGP